MRDYSAICGRLATLNAGDVEYWTAMQHLVDVVWEATARLGVSWVGFYTRAGDELLLGPRRDKPACSPIGLHGACGKALLERRPLIVTDVRNLGESYVACDPRDQAEVVLPLFGADEHCDAVLDLDSFEVGAFGQRDVDGLHAALVAAGLTAEARARPALIF